MRNIIFDFYATVLVPLCIVAAVSLWNSIRLFHSARRELCRLEKLLKHQIEAGEAQVEVSNEKWRAQDTKSEAKGILLVSCVVLLTLVVFILVRDKTKLEIAGFVWHGMYFISAITLIVMIGMACHYVKDPGERWQGIIGLKLWLCLGVMLLAAASVEHFLHLDMDTQHIVCPSCDDSQDSGDDN